MENPTCQSAFSTVICPSVHQWKRCLVQRWIKSQAIWIDYAFQELYRRPMSLSEQDFLRQLKTLWWQKKELFASRHNRFGEKITSLYLLYFLRTSLFVCSLTWYIESLVEWAEIFKSDKHPAYCFRRGSFRFPCSPEVSATILFCRRALVFTYRRARRCGVQIKDSKCCTKSSTMVGHNG